METPRKHWEFQTKQRNDTKETFEHLVQLPASRINTVLFARNAIQSFFKKGPVFIPPYQENRKRRKPLPKIGISKRFLFETSLKYVYRKTKFYSFKNGNIRWKIETVVKFRSVSLLVLFLFFSLFLFCFFSFLKNLSIRASSEYLFLPSVQGIATQKYFIRFVLILEVNSVYFTFMQIAILSDLYNWNVLFFSVVKWKNLKRKY